MTVSFRNIGDSPLKVSHELGRSRQQLTIVAPKSKATLRTTIGHKLVVEDSQGRAEEVSAENAEGLGEVVCEYQEREQAGGGKDTRVNCRHETDERDRYSGEKWDMNVNSLRSQCSQSLQEHPEDEAHFCHKVDYQNWFYAQCRFEFTEKQFYSEFEKNSRVNRASVDRKTTEKRFSERGFGASSIPEDLFQELQAYWRDHRVAISQPENHPKFDPIVSGCETDTWMLNLPWEMTMKVKDAMLPLIAEWAGQSAEDLEFTALYGIRMYRKGAKLHVHRDHKQTHVLSAILEIGQLEFGRPEAEQEGSGLEIDQWPLLIMDHNGTYASVPNSVGQLIFYESWSCPHGRAGVFQGREMANLFVHFAPKDWLTVDKSDPWKGGGPRPRAEL